MSVIIRLQNLPWSANALDIRQYFHGLSIPEGGVHIVGGELGDAFIAFSTDEDARQAFQRNNGKIKEVQITLHLSSRTEMQKVIEAARSIQTPFMTQPVVAKPAIVPPVATITPNISTDIKKDDQLSDSSSKKDAERSKNRNRRRTRSRSRSRERERTRDRSRDRSRDRRDRRRRDRSRSRDRSGRRRDRRDRSKSRERTRSRERDSRRSRENKPRTRSSERNEDSNHSGYSNSNDQKRINPWESNKGPQRQGSGMNNGNNTQTNQGVHPMMNQLEEARRSLNLIAGMQNQPPALQTNQTSLINQQDRRNPMLQNWIENNKREGSNPVPDRPVLDPSKQSLSAMFQQVQQQRPIINNRSMGMFQTQSNLGPRPNFNQESGNNFRPFMNRSMAEMMSQNQRNSPDYTKNSDDYRRDRDRNDYRKDRDESPPRRHSSRNEIDEHCVQLRPYWGGYGDLRRFFHGLFISNTGIKVLRESDGKRNGIIYIKFVRPESRQVALSKNGMKLKGFQVEISEISNADFDNYGSEDRRDEDAEDEVEIVGEKRPFTCLVVEDIPSFAKEHDMLKMFSDYSLLGIDIQSQNRKRYAYIQFNKEEDAQKALEETGKHILGGKQLVVKACPEKNLQNPGEFKPQQQQQHQQKQQQPKPDPKPLILEPPIEVDSPLQIKEDQPEVEPRQELLEDSNDQMDQIEPPYGNDDVIFLSGMPPKTTDRDVIDFFSDIGIVPINIHMVNTKFGPTGECYCEFGTPDEVISALDKNGQPLGNNIINVESFPRRDMDEHLGLQPGPHQFPPFPNRFPNRLGPMGPGPRPMGPMGFPRHPGPKPMMNPRFDNMVPHDPNLLPPGCVVEMRNVPYKAGIDEILEFFRNYDIHHQSVMRRYNDNGHPTGDARVTFNSPHEAKMAFEECKFKKIRDRTIFLNVL